MAGRAHQPCRARSATTTARRTSSGVAQATWPTVSPLAGSRTSRVLPSAGRYPLAVNEQVLSKQPGSAELGQVPGHERDERLS